MAKRKQIVPTKWWTVNFYIANNKDNDMYSIDVIAKASKEAIALAAIKLEYNDLISEVHVHESDNQVL